MHSKDPCRANSPLRWRRSWVDHARSGRVEEQVAEVLRRFDISSVIQPLTRCAHCNGAFETVGKDEMIDLLVPLTRIYYTEFRQCTEYKQIC